MALKAKKLNQDDIKKALGVLDGWRTSDDQIGLEKTFQFSDFNAAFGPPSKILSGKPEGWSLLTLGLRLAQSQVKS